MKRFLATLLIMTSTMTMAQNGTAATEHRTFSRETSVCINVSADPSIIWNLLVNASDYPRWNSTIMSIDGSIAPGEKIRLKSTLAPKRVFKLKIKSIVNGKQLVWGDGQGTRTYALTANADGTTTFTMNEKIGSLMFPIYAKHIPSFDKSFEQFAADLKKEAETIQNIKK